MQNNKLKLKKEFKKAETTNHTNSTNKMERFFILIKFNYIVNSFVKFACPACPVRKDDCIGVRKNDCIGVQFVVKEWVVGRAITKNSVFFVVKKV